jgi:hypothetical protein
LRRVQRYVTILQLLVPQGRGVEELTIHREQIVYTGFSLSYILGVLVYGVGRYSSEVSPGDYENGLKVCNASR